MLADVSCINFHSFVLGILSDGRQKNITLSDGVYTISTNSTSFQVSARPSNDKFQSFERGPVTSVGSSEIGLPSVKPRDLTPIDRVLEKGGAFVITFVSKRMCYSCRFVTLAYEVLRNVKNPHTVCKYLGILA